MSRSPKRTRSDGGTNTGTSEHAGSNREGGYLIKRVVQSATELGSGTGIGNWPFIRQFYLGTMRWLQPPIRCYGHTMKPMVVPGGAVHVPEETEPVVHATLDRLAQPGSFAIDIGGGIGVHTLTLASNVGPSGIVLAVEPGNRRAVAIRRHAELNGYDNVDVRRAVISDFDGMAPVTNATGGLSNVPIRRLDDVVGDDEPALIKVDVEGDELAVLRGAKDLLQQSTPNLVVEVHPEMLADRGESVTDLLSYLEKFGYANHLIDSNHYWFTAQQTNSSQKGGFREVSR